MKARTSLLLFPLLAACSVFDSSEGDPAGPVVVDSPPDRPAAPLDGTPQPSELDESLGVFVVATTEKDDADGTRSRPFGSIAKAIELAKKNGKRVYVCGGTYHEALVVADGVSIVGGLDCSTATWSLGDASSRSRIESPTSPAITARDIMKPTRIERLDLVSADATGSGASSIGLFAVKAQTLVVANSSIAAGNGANGADGTPATQLTRGDTIDGVAGSGAEDAACMSTLCSRPSRPGGAGGVSQCAGAPGHDGENGGAGGTGGLWRSEYDQYAMKVTWKQYYSQAAGAGETRTGAKGADGKPGASATTSGRVTVDGYIPQDGTRGTDGTGGHGGSGGHGFMPNTSPNNQNIWYGEQGSGGGGGGCPGLAGGAGMGGGASIAVLSASSAVTLDHVDLVAKDGGDGGKGALPSSPTAGGAGGRIVDGTIGTPGSPGGAGGNGGASGSGAGGPSLAIAHDSGAPTRIATTTTIGNAGAGVPAFGPIGASAPGFAEDVYEY